MADLLSNIGFQSGGMLNLSPKDAYNICTRGAIIVDVREEYMNRFKMFDVDEIIYCPKSIIEENFDNFPKNKTLVFADAVGLRSKEAVLFLIEKKFTNIANLAGGMVEWERDGMPIVINKTQRLTGSCMCQLKKREKK